MTPGHERSQRPPPPPSTRRRCAGLGASRRALKTLWAAAQGSLLVGVQRSLQLEGCRICTVRSEVPLPQFGLL